MQIVLLCGLWYMGGLLTGIIFYNVIKKEAKKLVGKW